MKLIFIMPSIGRKGDEDYLKTWQMEPLPIAQLSALTPPEVERIFFDDRLEKINYNEKADLVAITVETYTAKRAYQIAAKFRAKGIPVIMGGFHASFLPEEVLEHSDSVLIGEAENIWSQVIEDIRAKKPRKIYKADSAPRLEGIFPDRTIFKGKNYLPISLVETGRGCYFACEFCSITAFYQHKYRPRAIADIIKEIRGLHTKTVFFVDDNIGADLSHAKELFRQLKPLEIRWISQMSINLTQDREAMDLMKASGCKGVLIGFESFEPENLKKMNKEWSAQAGAYEPALKMLNERGITVYGTFIFGYDGDTEDTFEKTLAFAIRNKLFLAAFNHLVPFPGTALYDRLASEKRLLYDKWWLDKDYRFYQLPFRPKKLSAEELSNKCIELRKRFYSLSNIVKRAADGKANCHTPEMAFLFFSLNILFRKEISQREGLPLGIAGENDGIQD